MKVCKNFILQEFVSKAIFEKWGAKSLWFVDERIIFLAQFLRDHFACPIIINDWVRGGTFHFRGYRSPEAATGAALSQHKFGRAIDINVSGISPQLVYAEIKKMEGVFKTAGLSAMEHFEDTPTWTHLDIRQTNLKSILIIKP